MSASDALQPQQFHQLPMFMPAKDVVANHHPNDYRDGVEGGDQNPDHTWVRKLYESKREGDKTIPVSDTTQPTGYRMLSLYDHIKEKGVHQAVFVQDAESARGKTPRLWDGHHRAVSAASSRPNDLVPVLHAESMMDRMQYMNQQRRAARKVRPSQIRVGRG